MRLTRRDAVAALVSVGTGVGATSASRFLDETDQKPFASEELDVLVAVADVVYPTVVSVDRAFVETYSVGRVRDRQPYLEGMVDAIDTLDVRARQWRGTAFADLSAAKRDGVLRELGVDRVHPEPDGTDPQRVRYYVVNELLYALYTTPKGGSLVGLENPPGYPGGITSYQRGPEP